MTSKGLKPTYTFLARWAHLAILKIFTKALSSKTAHYPFDDSFLKALLFKGLEQVMIPNYTNRCHTRVSIKPVCGCLFSQFARE
jgi:hypothetical protein